MEGEAFTQGPYTQVMSYMNTIKHNDIKLE